jgi:serine/threonine protein kinase
VYEFLTGEALFVVMKDGEVRGAQEDADLDLFCQLNDTLGKVPAYMRKAGWRNGQWSSAEPNHLPPTHKGYFRKDVPYLYESLEARFTRAKNPDLDCGETITLCMLIRKMLAYDPAERPTAEELLKHPWFVEAAAGTK